MAYLFYNWNNLILLLLNTCIFVRATSEPIWGITATYHCYHILHFKHGFVALVGRQVKTSGKLKCTVRMIPKGKYIRNTNAISISNRYVIFLLNKLILKEICCDF